MVQSAPRELTLDESRMVVEPYFDEVKGHFVDYGLDRVARVRLECAGWVHDTERHYAACETTGRFIVVAPEFADLPEQTILAILAHEFGHAADYCYPGEFSLTRDGVVRRQLERHSEKQVRAWLSGWQSRDDHAVEVTADRIAEQVMQMPIGYCGPCLLQCFDAGIRRPVNLR